MGAADDLAVVGVGGAGAPDLLAVDTSDRARRATLANIRAFR